MNKTTVLSIILSLFMGFSTSVVSAQKVMRFSLDEAVNYAYVHNFGIINAGKDLEIAKQQVKEALAEGLPQIGGSITYHDNVARPVSLIPGDFFGQPGKQIAVQFGTKYDAALSGHLSQLIFDGRYLVGVKAAKVAAEKADKDFFKNKLAVREQVSNAYYQALSVKESLHIVDSTLAVTQKLAGETKHVYKEGMTDDVAVDQLDLLVSNLKTTHNNLKNQSAIAMAFLKFYLGLTEKDSIVLTENMTTLINQKEKAVIDAGGFNLNQNIDLQTTQVAKRISELQVKLAQAAYLPSINATVGYTTQAQRNVWNFFNADKWYQSAIVGVTMNIPIFSSGKRHAKVMQAKLAYEKMQVTVKQTSNQLNIQYKTLSNDYMNARKVYEDKDQNRKVAEKIYRKTLEKFKQGMASSLDLLNTHNQFLNAESDYVNAQFNLLQSAEKLQRLLTKAN